MTQERHENHIFLRGTVADAAKFSHTGRGVDYHRFSLAVPRLSGAVDNLNLLAPAGLLATCPSERGAVVEVTGQVRSFNNRSGVGSRLVITVLARTLALSDGPPANEVALVGTLCKPPTRRRTPLGREICDLMLAVRRSYRRADYLPCICWGSLAAQAGDWAVGDGVAVSGRLQSREYRKAAAGGEEIRTAFEISAMTALPLC